MVKAGAAGQGTEDREPRTPRPIISRTPHPPSFPRKRESIDSHGIDSHGPPPVLPSLRANPVAPCINNRGRGGMSASFDFASLRSGRTGIGASGWGKRESIPDVSIVRRFRKGIPAPASARACFRGNDGGGASADGRGVCGNDGAGRSRPTCVRAGRRAGSDREARGSGGPSDQGPAGPPIKASPAPRSRQRPGTRPVRPGHRRGFRAGGVAKRRGSGHDASP